MGFDQSERVQGPIYILMHNNNEHINLFNLRKIFIARKKKIFVEACTWDANYDRENNDYTNA